MILQTIAKSLLSKFVVIVTKYQISESVVYKTIPMLTIIPRFTKCNPVKNCRQLYSNMEQAKEFLK